MMDDKQDPRHGQDQHRISDNINLCTQILNKEQKGQVTHIRIDLATFRTELDQLVCRVAA